MTLRPGTRIGAHEVVALIGAGGMGEVYRARDTRLNREVALKVLPADVASDADRLARFRREAQMLAALNHPHIAQVHGLEEAGSATALVMEFVAGEDLSQRLARGPIPWADALPIARQIAEALEAAHDAGIVHRDLKPANVKVSGDGVVKVLDFGLAKAIDPGSGTGGAARATDQSPTITTPAMTQAGLILGTAAYMSPEQAKGRPVDKRTDVWAFGCVLYEMLTGTRAFEGEDVTDTLAAILRADPDWTRWPADAPEPARRLVAGCLDRDRRTRVADLGVVRYVLAQPAATPAAAAPAAAPPRRWLVPAAAAFVAGAGLASATFLTVSRPAAPAASYTGRFRITLEPLPLLGNIPADLAIAADGSFLVYVSRDRLAMRPLDELASRTIEGTAGGRLPFISPDGRWIGYFLGPELFKVPAAGGTPQLICQVRGAARGAAWGADGTIVFGSTLSNGLMRVPAAGGEPTRLTTPEPATSPLHAFPSWLPGGRGLLFSIIPPTGGTPRIATVDVASGRTSIVSEGPEIAPFYLPSGHLIASQPAEVRVAAFDPVALKMAGEFLTVADTALTNVTGRNFAASANGTLIFVPPDAQSATQSNRTLAWVDRGGVEQPVAAPARGYEVARIAPDGSQVALDIRDGDNDIWIWHEARRTLTRLTLDRAADMGPVWSPDGASVYYTSNQSGIPNVFRQRANGTGAAERLTQSGDPAFVTSIAPDGRVLALFRTPGSMGSHIAILPIVAESGRFEEPRMIVTGAGMRFGAEISPDGRWLAYQSTESGSSEIYVRPFPHVDVGRWQISPAGGTRPAWSRDGRELFYLDAKGLLTAVPVSSRGDSFSAASAVPLLKTAYVAGASARGLDLRSYDVSADGRRFLMIKEAASASPTASAPLIVVTNWFEELNRRISSPP